MNSETVLWDRGMAIVGPTSRCLIVLGVEKELFIVHDLLLAAACCWQDLLSVICCLLSVVSKSCLVIRDL